MIQDVLKKCNISPEQVDYVSAHATSTKLGDIVELKSIKECLARMRKTDYQCA